jgi:hypothetical protein
VGKRAKRKMGSSERSAARRTGEVERMARSAELSRTREAMARAAALGSVPRPGHERQAAALLDKTAAELAEFDVERLVNTLAAFDDPEFTQQLVERGGGPGPLTVLREAVAAELRSRGVDPGSVGQAALDLKLLDGRVRDAALRSLSDG